MPVHETFTIERLDTLLAEIPFEEEFVTERDCKRTLFAVTVIPLPLVGVIMTDELAPSNVTDLFTETDTLYVPFAIAIVSPDDAALIAS